MATTVWLLDQTHRQLDLVPNATAKDACEAMSRALGLLDSERVAQNFAIVANADGKRQEIIIPERDALGYWSLRCHKLCFRIVTFVDAIMHSRDPGVLNLRYIQAVHDVASGRLPVPEHLVEHLAALQLQKRFGPYNKSVHKAGFVVDRLFELVPRSALPLRKPSRWETDIFNAYEALSNGRRIDPSTEFLNLVEGLVRYGVHRFAAQRSDSPSGEYGSIFVNRHGVSFEPLDQVWDWTELGSWSMRADDPRWISFQLTAPEAGDSDKGGAATVEFVCTEDEAANLAITCWKYAQVLASTSRPLVDVARPPSAATAAHSLVSYASDGSISTLRADPGSSFRSAASRADRAREEGEAGVDGNEDENEEVSRRDDEHEDDGDEDGFHHPEVEDMEDERAAQLAKAQESLALERQSLEEERKRFMEERKRFESEQRRQQEEDAERQRQQEEDRRRQEEIRRQIEQDRLQIEQERARHIAAQASKALEEQEEEEEEEDGENGDEEASIRDQRIDEAVRKASAQEEAGREEEVGGILEEPNSGEKDEEVNEETEAPANKASDVTEADAEDHEDEEDVRERAAILLQAHARGIIQRNRIDAELAAMEKEAQDIGAIRIQAAYRGYAARRAFDEMEEEFAAIFIQAHVRRFLVRVKSPLRKATDADAATATSGPAATAETPEVDARAQAIPSPPASPPGSPPQSPPQSPPGSPPGSPQTSPPGSPLGSPRGSPPGSPSGSPPDSPQSSPRSRRRSVSPPPGLESISSMPAPPPANPPPPAVPPPGFSMQVTETTSTTVILRPPAENRPRRRSRRDSRPPAPTRDDVKPSEDADRQTQNAQAREPGPRDQEKRNSVREPQPPTAPAPPRIPPPGLAHYGNDEDDEDEDAEESEGEAVEGGERRQQASLGAKTRTPRPPTVPPPQNSQPFIPPQPPRALPPNAPDDGEYSV